MDLGASYPKVAFWTIAALALVAGGLVILPFAPALLWAVVLAVLFWPLNLRLRRRLSLAGAAGLTTLLMVLAIGVPILALGTAAGVRAAGFVQDLDADGGIGIVADLQRTLAPVAQKVGFEDFELSRWLEGNRASLLQSLRGPAGVFAGYLAALALNLFVALFAAYFFLRDADRWEGVGLKLMGVSESAGRTILKRLADTIQGVFVGTVLVAVVQGILVGIALALVRGPSPLTFGLLAFGAGLVPILGAPVVYLPLAGWLFLRGNVVGALVMLGAGIAVISQVDNVLRPLIVGRRVDLHPLAVFVFILGGAAAIGPVGLMAGPMILALLTGVRDLVLARTDGERTGHTLGDDDAALSVSG